MLKKLILWRYGRTTWQYDVLCLLILAFIFLTPYSWFENSELRGAQAHQILGSSVILLPQNNENGANLDQKEVESRIRVLTQRPTAVVREIRPQYDSSGKLLAYEVDIQ